MAMFLAEISFLLALALVSAGLVLWQRGRQETAGLLRVAALILVVGAGLTALCTGYYSVRYHVQGEFDRAYAAAPQMCAHEMMKRKHGPEKGGAAVKPTPPEHEQREGHAAP